MQDIPRFLLHRRCIFHTTLLLYLILPYSISYTALLLYLILQAQTEVEGPGCHIVVVLIISLSPIVGDVQVDVQTAGESKAKAGVEHQQGGIALVALRIEIERIVIFQVLVGVSLPSEDAVIVGSDGETGYLTKLHQAVSLHAVATAHIVVAVYHVVIVAQATPQQDAIHKDALLQLG